MYMGLSRFLKHPGQNVSLRRKLRPANGTDSNSFSAGGITAGAAENLHSAVRLTGIYNGLYLLPPL